ncbi:LTA synthase family protein [Sphingobacterium sp. LRF_L2]|uniref:LTA synthase family protein n=1 Tax=Sphingobacterium sp. LRF_L2 TaxID=3369421 RepID=UPI003F626A5E
MYSIWHKIEEPLDAFYAFLYGARLDLSLAAYLLIVPFLFFIIQQFWIKKRVSPWFLRGYAMLPTFLFAAVTAADLPLYEAWGEKISKRAITLGLDTMGGVSSSIDFEVIFQGVFVLVIFFLGAHYFYHRIVVRYAKYVPVKPNSTALVFVLGSIVLFLTMRGSIGRATLNQSSVYFSEDNTANHAAVNTYWSFLKSLLQNTKKNPYQFMDTNESNQIVASVLPPVHDNVNVLSSNRPNVVLILLEGMVAQVFEELGGESEVTPKMKELMDEGVCFKRAYAAADRSDKGMIAVMSGFPAQGPESIIKYIPKHEKLPAIGQVFDSLGYETSFYHGGQSEFYNFKSFMFTHGIERVVDDLNCPITAQRNSWGVYDHVIADRMLQDLDKDRKPFFSIFYTIVNHEPFHLEPAYKFGNKSKADAYRSTAFYTDSMIYNLVERAKKKDWYKNTIFVVTSDHGHIYPKEKYGLEKRERYHIPLFIFGGALLDKYKGMKVDDVVSQLDIAPTLCHFVGRPATDFPYGSDLFAKNRQHIAFFNSNSTFGVVTNTHTVSYDMLKRDVGYSDVPKNQVSTRDSLLHIAKGYYQHVFQDFLSY